MTFGAAELVRSAIFSSYGLNIILETGVAEVVMARKSPAVLRIFATSDALQAPKQTAVERTVEYIR